MKKILIIYIVLLGFTYSCIAKSAMPLTLRGLKQTIGNVHYLAKVKITNIEILHEGDSSEKHVYTAEVLATYKGETHKHIRYEMFVEHEEDVLFNSAPVFVALCTDDKGTYYWPGTGSEFKYSSAIDSWLTENKTKLENTDSTAEWCQ
ncbi:hypothetical protein ACM9HF_02750 [Colwellia sp. RE-S-Sl-9]